MIHFYYKNKKKNEFIFIFNCLLIVIQFYSRPCINTSSLEPCCLSTSVLSIEFSVIGIVDRHMLPFDVAVGLA